MAGTRPHMYVYGHEMLLVLLLLLQRKKNTLGFLSSKHTHTHTHTHTPDWLFTKPHAQKKQGKNPREGATDKQTNKQTTRKKTFYFVLRTPPPFLPPFSFPPNSALTKIPTIYRRITHTVTIPQKPRSSFPQKTKKKKK